jgi:hypothetical protein
MRMRFLPHSLAVTKMMIHKYSQFIWKFRRETEDELRDKWRIYDSSFCVCVCPYVGSSVGIVFHFIVT